MSMCLCNQPQMIMWWRRNSAYYLSHDTFLTVSFPRFSGVNFIFYILFFFFSSSETYVSPNIKMGSRKTHSLTETGISLSIPDITLYVKTYYVCTHLHVHLCLCMYVCAHACGGWKTASSVILGYAIHPLWEIVSIWTDVHQLGQSDSLKRPVDLLAPFPSPDPIITQSCAQQFHCLCVHGWGL